MAVESDGDKILHDQIPRGDACASCGDLVDCIKRQKACKNRTREIKGLPRLTLTHKQSMPSVAEGIRAAHAARTRAQAAYNRAILASLPKPKPVEKPIDWLAGFR